MTQELAMYNGPAIRAILVLIIWNMAELGSFVWRWSRSLNRFLYVKVYESSVLTWHRTNRSISHLLLVSQVSLFVQCFMLKLQ